MSRVSDWRFHWTKISSIKIRNENEEKTHSLKKKDLLKLFRHRVSNVVGTGDLDTDILYRILRHTQARNLSLQQSYKSHWNSEQRLSTIDYRLSSELWAKDLFLIIVSYNIASYDVVADTLNTLQFHKHIDKHLHQWLQCIHIRTVSEQSQTRASS